MVGRRDWFGLRRSLLAQEDAQDDEDGHREELRLPVLERLIPEIRLLQMLDDGLGRLLMPRASSLASLVLPTAWSPNDSRNRLNSALHSELEYSHRTAPPRRTSITPEPRKSHVLDVKSGRRSVLCRGRFNGPIMGKALHSNGLSLYPALPRNGNTAGTFAPTLAHSASQQVRNRNL